MKKVVMAFRTYDEVRSGCLFFFFQAEDGIRDLTVTGVQTCALPIWAAARTRRCLDACRQSSSASAGTRRGFWCRRVRFATAGHASRGSGAVTAAGPADRKSVVEGKRVDLGGRRIIKKKNSNNAGRTR